MPIPSRLPLSISILVVVVLIPICPPFITADELSVVSHPSNLQLPLGQPVDSSPGSRPGSIMTCNRVHIHGLSRLHHPTKFAHSLKVKISVSQGDAIFRIQTVELCFHRNASLGVGMCPAVEWQNLSKGYWVRSISPYGHRILDIRMLPDPSRSIELSTDLEFQFHRLVFLVLGMVMMATARVLSDSVVFYYGSAMAMGIILVILMVLFQGMRLLPTGRKSSLAIFMYSSIVGVATFLLRYLSGLLRSVLVEIGISEDMHNPLGIFLLVCLVLAGAWFGYWGVRKLVLTEDGVVDSGVAYFVEWAILTFSAVMILQSSLDTLLAAEALGFAIIITVITRIHGKSRFLRRLSKRVIKRLGRARVQTSPSNYFQYSPHQFDDPGSAVSRRPRAKHFKLSPCDSPVTGLTMTPPSAGGRTERENYYSIFHDTPERKRFSKEEWEVFTKEETRKALRGLVSSPDFNQWAVANAERIMVTPPEDASRKQQQLLRQRRFRWF